MLNKLRGQAEPAYEFAALYLTLLAEQLGLGALVVWFGAEGIEDYGSSMASEFDWYGMLANLFPASKPVEPQGQSAFCEMLRRHPAGDKRCHECDAKWIAKARRSGRSWTYQCHAGLSEVIAPIIVHGEAIGEIMGGQLASSDRLPGGFENVWQRVRDIKGLDREALRRAFTEIHVVDNPSLRRVSTQLRIAARTMGALMESLVGLMSREALLGQVRGHLERDFVSFALTEPAAADEEITARAKALGFSETPNAVIVIAPDRTSRRTFRQRGSRTTLALPGIFEVTQRVLNDVANCVMSSVRPDELVILLAPPGTRNPSLRLLRTKELAARVERELRPISSEPLLAGVSDCDGPFVSLAKAYEEACANIGKNLMPSMADDSPVEVSAARTVSKMTAHGDAVRRAVRDMDRSSLEAAVEAQLRLVAGCPVDSEEARKCLFTQMVLNLLAALRTVTKDPERMNDAESRYALAMPSLQTSNDMAVWFHAHLLPLVEAVLVEPSAKMDHVVAKACELTLHRLSESIARDDVAKTLGLSGTYFGKMFRGKTGMTFRDFVKRLRASKAQELLLLPGKTVADVADEVGYSSTAAFSRGFEQVCGGSPCAYRNNPLAFPRVILPDLLEA